MKTRFKPGDLVLCPHYVPYPLHVVGCKEGEILLILETFSTSAPDIFDFKVLYKDYIATFRYHIKDIKISFSE